MTMQLFSFGHPCEHQLRRTCIGGSSCPLNGYPDMWCCSFIKGKINFKRDKPCEGPRCRWGFTHPTQAQFDAVTNVLNESRPIAATLDDAEDDELLTFQIDNQHVVDTVLCTLHMMKHPPSTCAKRVGQLLAYAAVKMREPKVFMQLLKTMKKPVDGYILGAYFYLTNGNNHINSHLLTSAANTTSSSTTTAAAGGTAASSSNTHASNAASNSSNSANTSTTKGNKKQQHGNAANKDRKDDVTEDLKNDMVDLMNAALSQGGHLVDREDQHHLQTVFLQALKHYPKSNRKRSEMYEAAMAKFGTKSTRTSVNKVDSQREEGSTNNNSNNNAGVEPLSSNAASNGTVTSTAANTNNTITSGLEIKESGKKSSQAHKRDKAASQRNENKEHHIHSSANQVSVDRDETEGKAVDDKYSQRGSTTTTTNNLSSNANSAITNNNNSSQAGKAVHAKSSSTNIDSDRRSVNSKIENDTKASDSVNNKNSMANISTVTNNNSSAKLLVQENAKRDKAAAAAAAVVKPNASQITTPRLRRSPAAKPINLKTPQNDLLLDDTLNSTSTIALQGKDKTNQSSVSNLSQKFTNTTVNNTTINNHHNESMKQSSLSTHEAGDARGEIHVSSPDKSSLRETSLHSSKTQTPLPPSTTTSSNVMGNKKTPNSSLTSVGNVVINNNSTPKGALVDNSNNNRHSPSLLQPSSGSSLQSPSITLASNNSVHSSGSKSGLTKKMNYSTGPTLSNKRQSRPYDENEMQETNYVKEDLAEKEQIMYESTAASLGSHKMSTQHGQAMAAEKLELTDAVKQQQTAATAIQQEICRISKLAELMRMMPAPELTYDPIRTDLPLPEVFLFGGQFALTVAGGKFAPLGMASTRMKRSNGSTARSPEMRFNEQHEINNNLNNNNSNNNDNGKGVLLGQEHEEDDNHDDDDEDDDDAQQNNPFFISDIDNVMTSAEALNTINSNSNMFSDDIAYNGMSPEPMFENIDTAELLKDIAEGWASELEEQ